MKIYQRESLDINCYIPNQGFKPHPVLIISNNEINEFQDHFIGVMLSSSIKFNDDYSFWLENKMLTKPTRKKHR